MASSTLLSLPAETLLAITTYLHAHRAHQYISPQHPKQHCSKLSRTCRKLNNLLKPTLWRDIFLEDYSSVKLFASTLGAVLGALALYAMGRYGGRPLVLRYGSWLRVDAEGFERAEGWFAKYGDTIVLWARMVPLARSVVSIWDLNVLR